jgi:hypothetical protein
MTTGSNFSPFRGNNEGKTKLAICEEIAAVLKEKKVIVDRPPKQILDKIHAIEKSFKAAHDWINHTGQGVDDREQFREAVLKRCQYYYELEATMGDRAANQALVTNDDLDDDSLDDDKEEEMEEVNNRNSQDNNEDNDDNNEEEEAIDDDEEYIDEDGDEEDESQLRTPTNNSTISSRHSLLKSLSKNLSAAAGNKRAAASVPGTVVTSDKDKAKKAKNQKRNVKSPAINKMSADDNLISRILAIKQSTTQQGQQQQDNKWSTKTAEVEYKKKCMEYKTEEMEYKMKCMENIANLKRAGWSNPRIGKVFPEFILLLNGYKEDQDMDDCSSIQHSE